MGHKDQRPGEIVYILFFYNISFSWLLPLDGFQFIFLLRDSENDLYYKTAEPQRESFQSDTAAYEGWNVPYHITPPHIRPRPTIVGPDLPY